MLKCTTPVAVTDPAVLNPVPRTRKWVTLTLQVPSLRESVCHCLWHWRLFALSECLSTCLFVCLSVWTMTKINYTNIVQTVTSHSADWDSPGKIIIIIIIRVFINFPFYVICSPRLNFTKDLPQNNLFTVGFSPCVSMKNKIIARALGESVLCDWNKSI